MGNSINKLSEDLLLAVKMQENTAQLVKQIAEIKLSVLEDSLNNDTLKKAFWINIYNAFFQILRKENSLTKKEIYTTKNSTIANEKFSLDDIEHGILRKYKIKYSLGYVSNICAAKLIKKLSVDVVDYRIHFALNCGAKSCPPIAFYDSDKVEDQLEVATVSFLETETEIDENKKVIFISQLFKWYAADFGGISGTKQVLEEKLRISTKGYTIKFMDYSWEEYLDNYTF